MKKLFKYSLLLLGGAALLSSCDENTWNNKLPGFDEPPVNSTTTNEAYALTKADYATIASLKANKAIAEANGQTEALAAIGSSASFASEEQARLYIPAFLRDSTRSYAFLNDGSNVSVTYNLTSQLPQLVREINAGVENIYALTTEDYQSAWGSDDDYIDAFAPMTPAAGFIPGMLKTKYSGAKAGDFAIVRYSEAGVNPIFGGGGGNTNDWTPTDVLGKAAKGDNVEVKGYITALCTRGFIIADNSGSILAYQSSGFDASSLNIGDQVNLSGEISAYGTGLQIAITSDSYTVVGSGAYTYPAPTNYTGAMIDEAVGRSGDFSPIYCTITGEAAVSGNYYNIKVDGAQKAQGSLYYATDAVKAQVENGKTYTFTGYFTAVSSGKYFNMIITAVKEGSAAAPRPRFAPVSEVVAVAKEAIYRFDGSKWVIPTGSYMLQPADYTTMGQTYGNLSGTLPEQYLPVFLKHQYPYASAGQAVTLVYKYYDGAATTYMSDEYDFDGSEWQRNAGATTDKFTRKNGFWSYNPSFEITLPYSRNTDPSYSYYMACVNWVLNNVVKPIQPDATLTTCEYYVDYRGNAEFYSGASAYYGNVDVRASTAISNAPAGTYDGMTNDEITLLMKKRFSTEVLPGALKAMHPEAAPQEGMDVTYTIHFTAYTGAAEVETIVYTVTAPATFTYTSSTWVAAGQDANWK